MSWWDRGIADKNGRGLIPSGGISYPDGVHHNVDGFISAFSVALSGDPIEGREYEHLLCTTKAGTQVFIVTRASLQRNVEVYLPTETVNIWNWGYLIRLKKSGTSLDLGGFSSGYDGSLIAGEGSIYNFNYRRGNGYFNNPLGCFPRNKASAGATNQFAIICSDTGISFYVVGFSVAIGDTLFSAPARHMGTLNANTLNNRFWFDPEEDGIDPTTFHEIEDDIPPGPPRPIDYDYTGDDIPFPGLPGGASAIGFGRLNIFHPTASALAQALEILWDDPADDPSITDLLDKIMNAALKWWYKPEKYCVGLMLMPINVSGDQKKIFFGKYDTLALAPAISGQWQIVDCGSLSVPLKSGTSFDFSPHVKAMIYLPYIGFRPINVNEIMGGVIQIKYYVDMFTGAAVCFIRIANQNSNTSVLYEYECNVAQQIPIVSENYNQVISNLLSASLSLAMGNMGSAANMAVNAAAGLGSPDVQTSGKHNPNTGALGSEKPYVVLHFPVQSVPTGFVNQFGYPSNVSMMLDNLNGYAEIEKIHLNIPGATENELKIIEDALYNGVIL